MVRKRGGYGESAELVAATSLCTRVFLAGAEAHNGNREEALRLLIPLEREHLERHVAVYGLACHSRGL